MFVDKSFICEEYDLSILTAQNYVDDIVFRGMSTKMVDHSVQQINASSVRNERGWRTYLLPWFIGEVIGRRDLYFAKKLCEK